MVVWLIDRAGSIVNLIKLLGLLIGGILAIRKWILKPVNDLIEQNKNAVIELQKDYDKKREEVFLAVDALRKELANNDRKSEERHERLRKDFKDMRLEMNTVQDDVADVLGNELENGHHKFMTQGWCSPAEKQHYVDMHKRYSERGHNHLAQHYEEDLLNLPDYPPDYVG